MQATTPQDDELSRRERQIALAYADGASHREIGARLFIAPSTVRTHLAAIYRKLGVSSKIELRRLIAETAAGPAAPAAVPALDPAPLACADR
jgi:DNA-binding NarL/FixJ family response regulator